MSVNVFDLYAKLGLDSSSYDKGLKNASDSGVKFGNKITTAMKGAAVAVGAVVTAVGSASAAFIKATGDVAAYGDNIDKMSQKMGLTAQAYQEWDAVMQHSGTSMESLQAGMKTLASAAETGNKAFEALGISQKELATLSQQELFETTIAALQNVTDETQRTYLAGQLLGRGATELGALLNTSAEETQAMRDRVRELGGVMSDDAVKAAAKYQDTLQDMTTAFGGLKRNIVGEFMPSITTAMDGLTELFAGNNDKGIALINDGIQQFSDNVTEILPNVLDVGTRIVTGLGDAITKNTPKLLQLGTDTIVTLAKGAIERMPEIAKAGTTAVVTIARGIKDSLPELIPVAKETVYELADTLTDPDTAGELLDAGIDITIAIADGLIDGLVELDDRVPEIVDRIVDGIAEGGAKLLSAGGTILHHLADGFEEEYPEFAAVVDGAANIIETGITPAFEGVIEFLKGDFSGGIEDVCKGVEGTVSSTLGIIDGLFDTHLQEWYEKTTTFFEGLGRWAYDANADFYGLTAAQEEQAMQNRATELQNEIRREFNDLVREGKSASEAYSLALDSVVTTIADTNVFNDYLRDSYKPDVIEGWAAEVREAVEENERVAAEARARWEEATRKGEEYKRRYSQTAFTVTTLSEQTNDIIEQEIEQTEQLTDKQIKELEKQQKAAEKAAEKALKEQQKAAEKKLREQEKAEAAQTKALEKALNEREKIIETYNKNVEKIYDNIADIEKKYADTVQDRTKDIFASYSLFEEVPERLQVSGQDLMKNLEDQLDRMELFYSEIDKLSEKGVSKALVEDIRSQGVGALDNLDALLDMTDEEIAQYSQLYDKKVEFAETQAEKELESAKQEMYDAVADEYDKIEALTEQRSQDIAETFIGGMASGFEKGLSKMGLKEAALFGLYGGYAGAASYVYTPPKDEQESAQTVSAGAKKESATQFNFTFNGIQFQNMREAAEAMAVELLKVVNREDKAYA